MTLHEYSELPSQRYSLESKASVENSAPKTDVIQSLSRITTGSFTYHTAYAPTDEKPYRRIHKTNQFRKGLSDPRLKIGRNVAPGKEWFACEVTPPLRENKWCKKCKAITKQQAVARNAWGTFFLFQCLLCKHREPFEV